MTNASEASFFKCT